ncbi:hypothetical protein [Microbacterium tenebrionis]|uniref:hypothetical protein n=1 Tax=Microbacterium tenebrionis TaxID=2830665 RepID=UPI00158F11D1|nr:hypothetical protein [Microbacterium ihumii]
MSAISGLLDAHRPALREVRIQEHSERVTEPRRTRGRRGRRNPTLDIIVQLAVALEVPPADLLSG